MAAVIGSTEINIKKTGSPTTVPENPIAKLMYYFHCICSCVEADDENQNNYLRLSDEEEAKLLILCLALSPDKLIGTILFPVKDEEDLDGMVANFFEVSAVSTRVVVSQSLFIGGQQKKVHKILMFKKAWIENNYFDPIRSIQRGQRSSSRPALPSPPPQRNNTCTIL